MELTQQMLDIPIEHMSNVFGKFDAWLKQIEKYLQVTMVVRDGFSNPWHGLQPLRLLP